MQRGFNSFDVRAVFTSIDVEAHDYTDSERHSTTTCRESGRWCCSSMYTASAKNTVPQQLANDRIGSDDAHESFYAWDFIEYYLKEDQPKPEETQYVAGLMPNISLTYEGSILSTRRAAP